MNELTDEDRETIAEMFSDQRFDFAGGGFSISPPYVQKMRVLNDLTSRERIVFTLRTVGETWKVCSESIHASVTTAIRTYEKAKAKLSNNLT